jgi:phage gpG-like protein
VANPPSNMSSVVFNWNGDAVRKAVEDGSWTGLVRAGVILKKKMSETVGVKGHPRSRRSLPGEPPRVETNLLRKSISAVPDQAARVVRVGTNQPHGRYMEFGTRTIAPRPWVKRSYIAARNAMQAAYTTAIVDSIRRSMK